MNEQAGPIAGNGSVASVADGDNPWSRPVGDPAAVGRERPPAAPCVGRSRQPRRAQPSARTRKRSPHSGRAARNGCWRLIRECLDPSVTMSRTSTPLRFGDLLTAQGRRRLAGPPCRDRPRRSSQPSGPASRAIAMRRAWRDRIRAPRQAAPAAAAGWMSMRSARQGPAPGIGVDVGPAVGLDSAGDGVRTTVRRTEPTSEGTSSLPTRPARPPTMRRSARRRRRGA